MAAEPNNKYSEVVRVMRGIVPDEDTIQQDLDRLIQREGRRLVLQRGVNTGANDSRPIIKGRPRAQKMQ